MSKILVDNQRLPQNRMLFIPKENLTKEQLEIQTTGKYRLGENEECFVLQNMECCHAIMVTVIAKK